MIAKNAITTVAAAEMRPWLEFNHSKSMNSPYSHHAGRSGQLHAVRVLTYLATFLSFVTVGSSSSWTTIFDLGVPAIPWRRERTARRFYPTPKNVRIRQARRFTNP